MSGSPTDVGGDAVVRPETSATDAQVAKPEADKSTVEGAEAETQTQDQGAAEAEREKKREGGWQRKIRRLSNDVEALAAERDRYRALAESGAGQRQAPQTQASDDLKPPKVDDYKSYEEYERDKEAWVAEKTRRATLKDLEDRQKAFTEKNTREAEVQRVTKAKEAFETAAETVAEHYEDFDDAMDDLWRGRIQVIAKNDAVAEYIIEHSERGPELAYHLRSNQDVADRIGKLSPLAQVRELARLEASLPKPAAKTTQAPPPPKQVGSRGGADGKDPEKMSIEEMRKATGTHRKVSY